jgi:hypothetical protein
MEAQASISVPSTDDAVEELSGDFTLEHSCLILGEDSVVEGLIVQRLVEEPAEEQVVPELLAELPLAADAEERDQEAALEQGFRGNRRPARVRIHLVEHW